MVRADARLVRLNACPLRSSDTQFEDSPVNTTAPKNVSSAQKSVKTVLFAVLGLLGALFVGSIVWKGNATFSAYSSAVGQKNFDQGANRFIKGLFEVLMERLATNNGLQGADPARPAGVPRSRSAATR